MHVHDICRTEAEKVLKHARIIPGCGGCCRAVLSCLQNMGEEVKASARCAMHGEFRLGYAPLDPPMPVGVVSHLARIVVLSCQLAGVLGLDLESAIGEVIGHQILLQKRKDKQDAKPRILRA